MPYRPLLLLLLSAGALAAPAPPAAQGAGCLPTGNGYLRARIRGAMNLDVNWHNAELQCEGGPRPDGSGLRLAFAGPAHSDGRRLRLVFGVQAVQEGRQGRDLPTNLTVIFEGEERLFATRGEDHCTVDTLQQERVGAPGGNRRSWRVVARGFCVAPASTLAADARILVSRFDFAGTAIFGDDSPAAPAAAAP
ncbi:MAG: hypothetical protein JOZ67_02815 [Gammaproteobacteria bacterium]|nr:hypothetical protein [Gammaproteobacteria bacterium]MBV9695961.1 hypothetical protein [Gammaproteobacteria bacterium]